jgi:hypothetical protein
MTEIRKRAFVGIVGLVSAGLFSVGCSSSNTTGTGGSSGSAGSSGTAGTSGGTAGTTGSGGSTGAGGGAVATCGASNTATLTSASAAIDDFTTAGAAGVMVMGMGSVSAFGNSVAVADTTGGNLHVMMTKAQAAAPDYNEGFGIYFTECVDATVFTGVQFMLSGTVTGTGCDITFGVVDIEHQPPTNDPRGTAPAGSYAAKLVLAPTAAATMVQVPFTGTTAPPLGSGSPATAIDRATLLSVQWGFDVPMGTATCVADITIDNVAFY